MRISDWSSDVCSSDLDDRAEPQRLLVLVRPAPHLPQPRERVGLSVGAGDEVRLLGRLALALRCARARAGLLPLVDAGGRAEAATLAERRLVGVLLGQRLAPRIEDRQSSRLNSVTHPPHVCRLRPAKKKINN